MKVYRTVVALTGALLVSVAFISAQEKSASPSSSGSDNNVDKTYIGCLQPGTSGDNFVLTNAKMKGSKEKATQLKVVAATEKVNLTGQLTHQVEVKGTVDEASGKVTLTATSVKYRADYCG
jgi:hypothetical protein